MLFSKKPDDIEKLIKQAPKYEPNFKSGLTTEQILNRVKDNLVNHQRKTVTKSYFEIIFKNIFTVLNALLFTVAGCMIWLISIGKAPLSRLFFFAILLLNILISLFQDIKARVLVSRLTLISSPRASVVRNGNQKTIPFNEIVLSDIIVIKAGEVIPCDAKIVHGAVRLNESMLSGETDDVNKQTGDIVYAESVVTGGYGYARVEKISSANYASRLQEKSREFSRPKSEILSSLTYIIRVISVIAIVLGAAEIISCASLGRDLLESVDSIGSSIVAMIPMGMYLMTSITLTVGVIILASRRILVRELYSIEMLARVNIVCLDKTGTLTDGNMEVTDLISCSNRSVDYLKNMISHLLYITKDDNLTARALKSKFSIKPIKGDYSAIPFNSEQKFSAASFDKHTYVLGAYGFIKLSNDKVIKNKIAVYEKQGARVLIIAESNHIINKNKLPNDLKGVGFLVFKESIKLDAKANIEWLRQSNTAIRIISGDSVESLKAIANGVGLEDHRAISLSGLSESETKKAVHNYEIFARVTPEQKKIIINELRSIGNTVAMIGDGVNDLLALKAADCSIAMASGSNAAKVVSHLVSLDSNFSSIPKIVEEGRKVINNLQRVCSIFLVKTMFAMFMSTLFLFLPNQSYPFKTSHLLAWELLTIGIAPFFIALEPNKERIKGGFVRNIFVEAVPAAFIQIVLSLALLSATYIDPVSFPEDSILAVVVIGISLMSVIILLHVSMPLNRYRGIVLLVTMILMILLFSIDAGFALRDGRGAFLDINYFLINTTSWLLLTIVLIIVIPGYFLFGKLFHRILEVMRHE